MGGIGCPFNHTIPLQYHSTTKSMENTTALINVTTTPVQEPVAVTTIDPTTKAINAFRIIICIFGILGNLFVFTVIILSKEYKKGSTHWYVLQLALADTAFLLTLPFQVVEDTHDEWIFTDGMCRAKEAILFINYYSSVLFLMVMAVDRYFAICHGFSESLGRFRSHRATYGITATVWIVAILLSIPAMMYSVKRGIEPNCKCELYFPETPDYESRCSEYVDTEDLFKMCVTVIAADEKNDFCETKEDFFTDSNYYDVESEPEEISGQDATTYANPSATFNITYVTTIGPTTEYTTEVPTQTSTTNVAVATSHDLNTEISPSEAEVSYGFGCYYAEYNPFFYGILIFDFAIMFLIPFIVIAVCYFLIIRKVRKSRFKDFEEDKVKTVTQKKDDETKKRVTTMCMALVAIFAICWIPFNAVHLAKMNGIPASALFCQNIFYAATLMAYANSAINPYIYFVGASFKSKLKRARKNQALVAFSSFLSRTRITSTGSAASSTTGKSNTRERVKSSSLNVKEDSTAV